MTANPTLLAYAGRVLVVGTGAIARAVLPLLWRDLALRRDRVVLLGPDASALALAARHGVGLRRVALTRANLDLELQALLRAGDLLLNLALGVDSLELIAWCRARDVLYLDTNIEPWPGRRPSRRQAREQALALHRAGASTAVVGHGANPGLVSHFVRQALDELDPAGTDPADAARRLAVKVVLVSEFDSHRGGSSAPAPAAFVNTWSARGLAAELRAPAEIGWGAHEDTLPQRARLAQAARGRSLRLAEPGAACTVRAWSPGAGPFDAFVLVEAEDMDHRRVLDLAAPYLGELGGAATAWRPGFDRSDLRFARWRFTLDAVGE